MRCRTVSIVAVLAVLAVTVQGHAGCCMPDGSCQELDWSACASAGGIDNPDSCTLRRCERSHPGWNHVSTEIMLTKNEPTYWSALTGQPKGVAPFRVLDPGSPAGRPDPEGSRDRVLRGYIVGWAVDGDNSEIRWNHLKGDALLINYRDHGAWEYNAWAFQVVSNVAHGEPTRVSDGELNLDGNEYTPAFDALLLDFYAYGARPFAANDNPMSSNLVVNTDLTLHPVSVDLRQEDDGPVTTKAKVDVWNENEVKFNGTERCITCWDQVLLVHFTELGIPNNFLHTTLQTDKGKARIDGIRSDNCDFDYEFDPLVPFGQDPRDIVSQDAAMLGVAAKLITLDVSGVATAEGELLDMAGFNLFGMGTEAATISYDTLGPPPEAVDESDQTILDELYEMATSNAVPQRRRQAAGGAEGVGGGPDRVSATEKGSLLVYSKVEIRWDGAGALVQDTFIDMTNDFGQDVRVQMYFINGDPPLKHGPGAALIP